MKTLIVDKQIYSARSMKAGIIAFREFAKIQVTESSQKWRLSFIRCKYDEDLTIKEFENYIIGLENSHEDT